eukprot:7344330-Prorocentrum_lima.AAC.1
MSVTTASKRSPVKAEGNQVLRPVTGAAPVPVCGALQPMIWHVTTWWSGRLSEMSICSSTMDRMRKPRRAAS